MPQKLVRVNPTGHRKQEGLSGSSGERPRFAAIQFGRLFFHLAVHGPLESQRRKTGSPKVPWFR